LPQSCVLPGVQVGVPVHEHVPQVQLLLQVCVPSVSQLCDVPGAQP
jgi:hypothetical protein